MSNLVIGTAGHIDHGKTTLIKALTGIDTDRLPQEKIRNITIENGYAYLDFDDQRFSVIDVPGHEKFIKNMLSGAAGIDYVILVIAADDGIMPQTIEHLNLLNLLKVKNGCIALTKSDLVSPEIVEQRKIEIEELVDNSFLKGAPIFKIDYKSDDKILHLKNYLKGFCLNYEREDLNVEYFKMYIDRAFILNGVGQVVTGTTQGKTVHLKEKLMLFPSMQEVSIRQIQSHNEAKESIAAGTRCSLNITAQKDVMVHKGDVLTTIGHYRPTSRLDVTLELIGELKQNERVKVYIGSDEILGRFKMFDTYAQLVLEKEVLVHKGEIGIIRKLSPAITLGGFTVTNPYASKNSQGQYSFVDHLKANDFITQKELQSFDLQIPVEIEQLNALTFGDYLIHQDNYHQLVENTINLIQEYYDNFPLAIGLDKQILFDKLNIKIPYHMFTEIYVDEPRIIFDQSYVKLRNHNITLTPEQITIKNQIVVAYKNIPYTPPKPDELKEQVKDKNLFNVVFKYLVDFEILIRIYDDIYLLDTQVKELATQLEDIYEQTSQITLQAVKDYTNASRKFNVAYLEYFDKINFTRRVDEYRVIVS